MRYESDICVSRGLSPEQVLLVNILRQAKSDSANEWAMSDSDPAEIHSLSWVCYHLDLPIERARMYIAGEIQDVPTTRHRGTAAGYKRPAKSARRFGPRGPYKKRQAVL